MQINLVSCRLHFCYTCISVIDKVLNSVQMNFKLAVNYISIKRVFLLLIRF